MPNVETLVIQWLKTVGDCNWQVSGDMLKDRRDQIILVDRTGGAREAMVLDRAEILIEVYHKHSRLQASDKAQEIADHIPELLLFDESITHAQVNSIINLPRLTN